MTRRYLPRLFFLLAYAVLFGTFLALGYSAVRDYSESTRGILSPDQARDISSGNLPDGSTHIGVNVALEQYSDADLERALTLIQSNYLSIIRQHFYWNDIEPRAGDFQWSRWDAIVAGASEHRLDVVAVLDTTPEWARDPGERDLVNAAPANAEDYARFVAAFVRRYGDRVQYIQVWDNPNVQPFWGRRNADPVEYTELLRAAASAARAAKPQIKILSAGLAPNSEMIREHPNYSDVMFLRGMYDAGAKGYFDILGAKAYGMWTGPEDRRVSIDVFNFSRVILLRDELAVHNDGNKPIWAVEMGWNALPAGWEGNPSPWGTDTETVQSKRLENAVIRARSEWAWMGALIVQTFQPNAPSSDPQWGFSLVDANMQPRSLLDALAAGATAPVVPPNTDATRLWVIGALLALVAGIAVWRGAVEASHLPWREVWKLLGGLFESLPEAVQFALLAAAILALYYSRSAVLNVALLVVIVVLFAFRLDLGLVLTVITIPFYLFSKNLVGSMQFSMVEILTLVALAAWLFRRLVAGELFKLVRPRLTALDWAIVLVVVAGLISVKFAMTFGVASREFRVIVLEPALLYGLVRASGLTTHDIRRLVDALIFSAFAISLIGLYQFFFTNYVIVGEGVRRILAVYGSPNNLALYLDRAIPLITALVLYTREPRRRIAYLAAGIPIALSWFLTYSRGAWVGVGAGLIVIALLSRAPRVRLAVAVLIVAGIVVAIPFLGTARAQSLFQSGTGTGFFRVSAWQAGVEMIRDHPLFGVGLDNFLYEYPKYMQAEAWREPNLSHPHNVLLDFWVRMGVLGVVALVWMVAGFYRKAWQLLQGDHRALALGLIAGMTAALAHGMLDAAFFYVDLAFVWMLMVALVGNMARTPSEGSI